MDKRPNKDRNKKEIFVIGRKPNLQLWNELEAKARGSKDHQIEAVEALVLRIRELPEDADELLVSLSKSASLPVKRRLTTALASKPNIPWGLWISLLQNLADEEDEEIKQTVDSLLEPFRQLSDSMMKRMQWLVGPDPNSLIAQIKKQQAELSKLSIPFRDIQQTNKVLSNLLPQIQNVFRTIPPKNLMPPPQIQIPRYLLDSMTAFSRVQDLANRQLAGISPSYYPPERKLKVLKASDHPLIAKLKAIQPGKQSWGEYQKQCRDILTFCLVPPLLDPLYEETTSTGIHRRDVIFHIPHDVEGFWGHVKTAYGAIAMIVDAKNYSGTLPKDQLVIFSKYFGPKKLGNFGIIVTRIGLDDSGSAEQADRWLNHSEMIVCLTDYDLENMMGRKLAGGDPEYVIDQKIRELRTSL